MIARGFLEAGAKVYISSRKKEVCDDVAQQLSEAGECISLAADVSRAAGCEALAKEIAAREPKLHILMSGRSLGRNAGRLSRNRV
jgi:NAD(P)-dependent dehydrogenase (short-subunit alcohol dehydrogenase family)